MNQEHGLATAEICSGICGFTTTVQATIVGPDRVALVIESDCEAVRRLAEELATVSPIQEIAFRGPGPLTLRMAAEYLRHAACPVPAGIIKAVEVAAGLALPADVSIRLTKSG